MIQVDTPDGGVAEFPDGTSPDVMRNALRAKFGGGPAKSVSTDVAKQAGYGAVQGLINAATTIGGGLTMGRMVRGQLEKLAGTSSPENAPKTTEGEFARTAGSFVANPVSYTGAGSTGIKIVQALTSALGSEGLRQLVKGQGPLAEGVASIVGAVLGGRAPSAANRVRTGLGGKPLSEENRVQLSPEEAQHAARVEELRGFGVEPTAGDVTGSKFLKRSEGTLGSAPLAGGAAEREETRIGQQLTDAVVKEMGGTETTKDTDISEILANNRDRLQKSFENVATNLPINRDKKFGDDIGSIFEDLHQEGLPTETYNRLSTQIKNILRGFDPTKTGKSVMKGKTYQSLTRKDTPLSRDINSNDPNLSYYATRIRTALDDAMERSANARGTKEGTGRRAALQELKDTRRQWYTMLVLSKAVASSGEKPAHGIITPARLRALIANTDDNKVQYALQRSNLARLSRSANAVLTQPPNSNTAERGFITAIPAAVGSGLAGVATGGWGSIAGAAAGAAAPGLTGRALLSSPVQSYLKNQGAGRLPPSAARSAAVAGSGTIPGTPTEKTAGDIIDSIVRFARGGLTAVAEKRGINIPGGGIFNSQGLNDALVGMPGAAWTKSEETLLKLLKSYGLRSAEIAERMGKTPNSIDLKASRLGLSGPYGEVKFTPQMDAFILKEMRLGTSMTEIAKHLELTRNQVDYRVRLLRGLRGKEPMTPELAHRGTPSLPRLKFMEGPGPDELGL